MKDNKIIDFNVRVWGNTVFINDKDNVNYMYDIVDKFGGLQCNYVEGTREYAELLSRCDEIAKNFAKMKELFDANNGNNAKK